jgi:PPOX class probable F420-dependent enzyme
MSEAQMTAASEPVLGDALCLSLRTFRKDGTPVDTPVWVVDIGGKFCMYTDGRSYKAKRLRRNPRVEVAACDVWGKLLGPRYSGVCRFVDDQEQRARVFALLRKKYHIHAFMSDFGARLTGRIKHRLVLEITLDAKG